MTAVSFIAGLALGYLHFRWFQAFVEGIIERRNAKVNKVLVALSGMGRYLFTYLAGISLIQTASLDAISLCGGLIAAMAVFRVWQIRSVYRLEESQKSG